MSLYGPYILFDSMKIIEILFQSLCNARRLLQYGMTIVSAHVVAGSMPMPALLRSSCRVVI